MSGEISALGTVINKDRSEKRRILIVDDDPDITNAFGLVLEDSGLYEVDAYNEPLIALRDFRPNFYDLAILDIRMPNMSGFELFYKMERIDNKVKACFISAYDMNNK